MQRTISRFTLALVMLYVAGVCVLAVQPLRTYVASGSQGVLYKGGDESQYIMRVQDATHRPFTEVSNAIIGGPDAPRGLQMSFLEMLAGSLFGFLGLSGPDLTILLSLFLAPLSMVFIGKLAERLGCSHRIAVLAAALYFFLLFGPLRRVVHQAWSLPYVLGTMLVLLGWWREPTRGRTLLTGLLLGLVPGIYVWAWTYLWAAFGVILLLGAWERAAHREYRIVSSFLWQAFSTGMIALVIASPFLILMWVNGQHPAADVVSVRSSLIHAREFESVPRSIVLLLFMIVTVAGLIHSRDWKRFLPLTAFVIALFLVVHQQFVHGIVLSYWTHYYPYVCAVAVLALAMFLNSVRWGVIECGIFVIACVFLLGAFFDYKGRTSALLPLQSYERVQHLRGLLDELATATGSTTVLSDTETSLLIGTYTNADLTYTEYLRHVLIDTRELAERYCLTELLKGRPPDTTLLANNVRELSAAGRQGTQETYALNLVITEQACAWVIANPAAALERYRVSLLAWDERNHPEWRIDLRLFIARKKGPGWSVWERARAR